MRQFSYAAGPSALPMEVLEKCSQAVISFTSEGESILEVSHRSKAFQVVIDDASRLLRELLVIPDNYHVLFMQGGGTGQFAASALNALAHRKPDHTVGDYLVTGNWSQSAANEAKQLGIEVNIVSDGKKEFDGAYRGVPLRESWKLTDPSKAAYFYYCANETVYGVEAHKVPDIDPSVPLICDMSSNILSRTIDVSKFGIIFAGAQKNLGPAGVTIAIVRDDILQRTAASSIPTVMDYAVMAKSGSMYNTPPTFSILALKFNLEWASANGGNEAMEQRSRQNSSQIYQVIDKSNGFYSCPVVSHSRSLTNIVFNLPTPELESEFVSQAAASGLINLKGHRSVGGIRASLYNGVPDAATLALAEFMDAFLTKNTGQ
ncbi:hypothetical protein DSO57_1001942 [Entomophthora muscae]|uniref:Uncharacterized protein n=1 Tax=Entomophthora muscae TaxID=34485 RepID=A0ACC2UU43_9FUNG|nr:hypothetical protein DSO57_1001942 [Entomophthora muscae]